MTILLTQAVRVGGSILAAGTTQTLDAALEGDLVTRRMATYVSDPATELNGVPVTANVNHLTGGGEFSAGATSIDLITGQYTWALLPSASSMSGKTAWVSDVGGAGSMWKSNGTRWKPVGGSVFLGQVIDRPSTSGVTSKNIGSILIPAGLIQDGDRLRCTFSLSKSGASETATLAFRFGSVNTVSDASFFTTGGFSGTNQSLGAFVDVLRKSATSMQKLGNGQTMSNAYSGPTTAAFPSAVTVENMDSTAMYLHLMCAMSSTVEVVTLEDMLVELVSP